MEKTALLVIDMQNDFIEEGSALEVAKAREGLTRLADLIINCRNKGIPVIFTRHIFDPAVNPIEAKLFKGLMENSLKQGSHGSKVHDALSLDEKDIIIKKTRYDAFMNTPLERILKEKGITNLIITGTMTNICCESTARTAMMKDFDVLFCSDLTFTRDDEIHNATLKNIGSHFGKVLSSQEINKML